jgi:hypothetical protein
MPNPIRVTVAKDTATPALKELLRRVSPMRPLMMRLGKRLELLLRKYFAQYGQSGNFKTRRRGWPTQHFWDRRIRNATSFTGATEHDATVTISDPAFMTHYRGATIRPREKSALAIPLQAAAYGKRKQPSSGLIPGLFLLRTRKGAYLVAYGDGFGKPRKGVRNATLHFYYKLLKSVTVPKDPKAVPPDKDIEAALLADVESYMKPRTQA